MKTTIIKKMVPLIVIALFLSGLTANAGTFAYGNEKAAYCKKPGNIEKISEELGLTPEQQELIKKQRAEFMEKNKDLGKRFRSKRVELKKELEKPKVDKATVDKIIADLKELTGEKLQNRVDKILSMKQILTPEQFDKLSEKTYERKERFMKKRRHRR